MTRRAALTQDALVALGAEKLARLVLSGMERDPAFKRLVTAALAGARGPAAVAAIIDRRLAALERARGFVDWSRRKAFAADLAATLQAITGELGPADPAAAADRLLRLLVGARAVFDRVDDAAGQVQHVYDQAAGALVKLLGALDEEGRAGLASRLVSLIVTDEHGFADSVLAAALPLLPVASLPLLDDALATAGAAIASETDAVRRWTASMTRDRVIRARQAIAEAQGDVDALVALERTRPPEDQNARMVAERLLAAGRAQEALDWVCRARPAGSRPATLADQGSGAYPRRAPDLDQVRLEARILDALGEHDKAQALRWQAFEVALDADTLREYVQRLPDFEDDEALELAFAHALARPHRSAALTLFLAWPRLDLAAKLVLLHQARWEGHLYHELVPAAEALEPRHPYAAAVLYRALLDNILNSARSPAYGHAARYLATLDLLPEPNPAPAGWLSHAEYRAGLARAHARKAAFWAQVGA